VEEGFGYEKNNLDFRVNNFSFSHSMKKKIIYIIVISIFLVILGVGGRYLVGQRDVALSQDQKELVREFGWPSVFSLSFGEGLRFELWAYHDFTKTFIFDDGQFQIASTSEIFLGDAEFLSLKPNQFRVDLSKEELIKQLGQPTGQIEIPVSDKKVEYLNFGNELVAIFRDGQISTIQTFAKNPAISSHLSKSEKTSIYESQIASAKGSRWDTFIKWLKDSFFITTIQQFSDSAGKYKISQRDIGRIGDGDIKFDRYERQASKTYENKEYLKCWQGAVKIGTEVELMTIRGGTIPTDIEKGVKLVDALRKDVEDYAIHEDESKEYQDALKEQKQILETDFGRKNPSDLEREMLDIKTRVIAEKMGKDTKGKSTKSLLQDKEVKNIVQRVYRKKPAGSLEALMQRIDDSISEIQEELGKAPRPVGGVIARGKLLPRPGFLESIRGGLEDCIIYWVKEHENNLELSFDRAGGKVTGSFRWRYGHKEQYSGSPSLIITFDELHIGDLTGTYSGRETGIFQGKFTGTIANTVNGEIKGDYSGPISGSWEAQMDAKGYISGYFKYLSPSGKVQRLNFEATLE